MRSVLTKKNEITSAVHYFRQKIRTAFSEAKKVEIGFPGGGQSSGVEYSAITSHGMITIMIPDKKMWNQRIPHLVNLNPSAKRHAPDVELNIPMKLDRNVSACYVQDGKDILICSRGKFTVFKSPILKPLVLDYFREWLIPVQDGDRETLMIPVAALSSPGLSEQIAEFVSQVKLLKEKYKEGIIGKEIKQNKGWRQSDEYQGNVKKKRPMQESEYEYLHGPICNSLRRYLEEISNNNVLIRSNKNVDIAIVCNEKARVIFEVKTSLNLSNQIYKGIGQLLCYKAQYGLRNSKLFLVLPQATYNKNKINLLKKVFKNIGITLIFWDHGKFVSESNRSLSYLLNL
ncbi:MAG TPA: hypothetical protein PKW17_10310 [Smithellaceae bacterium]|nr:hypothetical protein [Smithellaceae bacterium]